MSQSHVLTVYLFVTRSVNAFLSNNGPYSQTNIIIDFFIIDVNIDINLKILKPHKYDSILVANVTKFIKNFNVKTDDTDLYTRISGN